MGRFMRRMRRVRRGRGPAFEVFRKGAVPTRYRYHPGTVMHKGRKVRMRLGFKGNKVTEVAFVRPRKKR